MKIRQLIIFSILSVSIAGCNQNEKKESELALIQTTNPNPALLERNTSKKLDLVASIEQDIESTKELYDVAIIKGKKDTLVAYKVKHLHRFRMKKIEKKLNDMLEDKYPQEKFIVSSDYKIFLEAVKLNEKMKDPNFTQEKANKKLDEIIKLKQEMT